MSEWERGVKFPWLTNCGGHRATGIPTVMAKFESRFSNKGEEKMILVSSCLLKINTKYDGTNNECKSILNSSMLEKFIPVCPEQLGGLPTPRCPVEIFSGSGEDVLCRKARVLDIDGLDYTEQFIKGAYEVLKISRIFQVKAAIFKERSPSCGSRQIYDGNFSTTLRNGEGVTTALIRKHNIAVYSEKQISEELLKKLLVGS